MSYPPPTLVPRRSRASLVRRVVVVGTLGLLVGTCTVSRFLSGGGSKKGAADINLSAPIDAPPDDSITTDPSAPAGDQPVSNVMKVAATAAGPAAVAPAAPATIPAQPSPDAREPNHWYYVQQIGDGPGAIYSRSGGGWDYAFACTAPTRTLEFIAVNVGDPGAFDRQYMRVGRVKMMMDPTYSKQGHGTLSTKLSADHPFFTAFTGPNKTLELELLQGRKTVLAIGPEVTRVIRECRAGAEGGPAVQDGGSSR